MCHSDAKTHSPHPLVALAMRQTPNTTHDRVAIAERRYERSAGLEKIADVAEEVSDHRLGKEREENATSDSNM